MTEIKLSNGTVISNLEERIREYCRVEIYHKYDDCHDVNNIITLKNIDAANKLYARISKTVAERVIQSESIRNTLAVIDNKEMGEINKENWKDYKEKLYHLLLSFCSIKGVGIAVATKILHLKRPKLIPILDSFVVKFLLEIDIQDINKRYLPEIGIKSIDMIREDIMRNLEAFTILQERLSDLSIPLSKVRLYDILVWSTEKWIIRGYLTAPYGRPKVPMMVNSSVHFSNTQQEYSGGDTDVMNEVGANWREIKTLEEFREGMKKGEGYVVITDTANPNKVHKPSCPWVKEEYFEEKVVQNKCRNGHYYWTDKIDFAKKKWGAEVHPTCVYRLVESCKTC